MAPEAKSEDLLYLSDVHTNDVYVYAYPGGKLIGTLTSFGQPRSECSDSSGDVWIADVGGYDVVEYPHGGTSPIVALSTAGAPEGCSVSPTSGDLAVVDRGNGVILSIYHAGVHGQWRDPKVYADSNMRTADFCGYDSQGNLFIDGVDKTSGHFHLAELPHGGDALTNITVSQKIDGPGQVQWDGTNLAIGDTASAPSKIYRFSVSGKSARKVGSTALGGSTSVRQFWIQGRQVIGPDFGRDVGFWKYPMGGSLTKKIARVHGYGATISLAGQSRSI
jgi:hypothetical protein